MRLALLLGVLVLGGCGFNVQHSRVCDEPVGAFKKCYHTVNYETEPQCVGSCNPNVKSW